MRLEAQPHTLENSFRHHQPSKFPNRTDDKHSAGRSQPEAELQLFVENNGLLNSEDDFDPFISRFEQVQPRIDRAIRYRWGEGLDPFETDNLVQAAYIHLWLGYKRDPEKFNELPDAYWLAVAKRGAFHERIREFQEHYCQKGSGDKTNRRYVEVVVSAGDVLASRTNTQNDGDLDNDEADETLLSQDTIYSNNTADYTEVDTKIEISRLIELIHEGTSRDDHPLITSVLTWMSEGLTWSEMARKANTKLATIKCTVRRIRQACGALQTAKDNKRHHYGISKDHRIQQLLARGVNPQEIARLIGTDHAFVYRRLRALELVS